MTSPTFVQNPKTASRVLEGEAVIVTAGEASLHILNGVGTFVWELLAEERRMADLVTAVTARFAIDAATAEKDCAEFLASLESRGLVLRR